MQTTGINCIDLFALCPIAAIHDLDMNGVRSIGYVLLTLVVVVGLVGPATAVGGSDRHISAATMATEDSTADTSNVNVTTGPQLATVLDATEDEVQTDVENTGFEVSLEGADEETRAEVIAERAEELRERAEDIREQYEEATEAYEEGEIDESQYAQRLATLNARATNLLGSYEQLRLRAADVSALELRAAGVNQSALDAAVQNLENVNGTATAALFEQFTGQSDGHVEIERSDGVRIEITSEGGEQSREIERPQDDDPNLTVSGSAAFETARGALSTPERGNWTLTEATVKSDDGTYEFEFELRGDPERTGEAEVAVDGSTGEVYSLEEEIELRDDADDERDDDADDADDDDGGELVILVADGSPAPGETVTLEVLADGSPAENVTVTLNDRIVGTTSADGTIVVTLPESGEAEIEAHSGDAEGELEFEFEDDDEDDGEDDDEVASKLAIDAERSDETVTVTVTYDGSAVANATVYANDNRVGITDTDGGVSFEFDTNETDTLDLEIEKGEFEADVEYELRDGSLVKTESEDDDEVDSDEEAEDDEDAEADDDEDTEADDEGEADDEAEDDEDGDDEEEGGEEY